MKCDYCQDEICVNADCPMIADYCPYNNDCEDVCEYAKNKSEGGNL